jgi:hypothetical protein
LGKHVYPQQFGDDSFGPPVFCLLRTAHNNWHQSNHHHCHQNDDNHHNNAATAAMTITNASTSTATNTVKFLPLDLFSPPTEYFDLSA